MARKKRRTEEEIHEDILKFLEAMDFPRTTEEIAKGVGLNWYAATTHLTKLRMESKVFHKKVGKQNQWWPENVKEQKEKIRGLEKEIRDQNKKHKEEVRELKDQIRGLEERIKKLKK